MHSSCSINDILPIYDNCLKQSTIIVFTFNKLSKIYLFVYKLGFCKVYKTKYLLEKIIQINLNNPTKLQKDFLDMYMS